MDEVALNADPVLFGRDATEGIVSVEHVETRGAPDRMELVLRRGDGRTRECRPFEPFILAEESIASRCPGARSVVPLQGNGPLDTMLLFGTWKECQKAKAWLGKAAGVPAGAPEAPYLFLGDPVHQYLLRTGQTLFRGMRFEDLRRLQVDIECDTTPGFQFCNAEREGDRILAIALSDSTGWQDLLSAAAMSEEQMLRRLVEIVRERDPDVIEGHNIFNFDLPYIEARAARWGVKLALGRDGGTPVSRPSRLAIGERTIAYARFEIWGRHVVDTLFLVQGYDAVHRSLEGFGLKEVAIHFGVARSGRTYIPGEDIGRTFHGDPARVHAYAMDDVLETLAIAGLLSRSAFIQAQMLPYSYQTVCVRGNATKVDALILREYLAQGQALPRPDAPREFAGGYTDVFVRGVIPGVHHCDVRSLYPSLILVHRLAPRRDACGVFLGLLAGLREFRLRAKERMKSAGSPAERLHYDALQTTFKVLINSFYGYLGFAQARFNDFDAAEEVTRRGRELLRSMIEWLRSRGATPVEIDTDGIYFVPPARAGAGVQRPTPEQAAELDALREDFSRWLPPGIEIEFDGEYRSMFSYKMKNYALLGWDGTVALRGAALKSRGLEPFQRDFLRRFIRLRLEGRDGEIEELYRRFRGAIERREWPVSVLAKSETLQDSPAAYAAKRGRGGRSRSAAYELALQSGRDYRAGDMVTFYVTGSSPRVSVAGNSRLVSEWSPERRDENVAYYLAKLDALYAKFTQPDDGAADGDGAEDGSGDA